MGDVQGSAGAQVIPCTAWSDPKKDARFKYRHFQTVNAFHIDYTKAGDRLALPESQISHCRHARSLDGDQPSYLWAQYPLAAQAKHNAWGILMAVQLHAIDRPPQCTGCRDAPHVSKAWQQQCAAQAHASSSDEESNEIPADHAYCQLLKLTHHLPRNRSRARNAATARSDTAAPACAAPSGNGRANGRDGRHTKKRALLEDEHLPRNVTDQVGPCAYFKAHFEKVLTDEQRKALSSNMSSQLRHLDTVGWQPSQIRQHCIIQTSALTEPEQILAPKSLAAYGIKPRIQGTFQMVHGVTCSDKCPEFPTTAEAAAFAMFHRYMDVMHMCHPYATAADEVSAEESASLLHAANHIINKMDTVKKNNHCLANRSIDKTDARDQGFVRPAVLMLVPMRCVALTIALRFASLAQRENRHDSIQGKERLLKEFSAADDAVMKKDVKRPAEHKALFSGTNTDDHFCLGIKVTRGAVKFYAPLYESDVILASPLALATRLAEGGKDKGDILSSIDVAIIYRGDIMLMQNWAHVETVLQALNQIPSRQHDSDIMRVRQYFLEDLGKRYRQTIFFSSFEAPEFKALANTFCNNDGVAHISCQYGGVLNRVVPQANHLFQKFPSGSHQHVNEARFQHFSKYVWPRIADARAPGVLLFVSSYFDFVRVRNFLKAQQASFGAYCEYTHGPDVLRVRTRFAKQERRIMLYTERAHFYFRPSLRGVHEVVFYSLPQHAEFYLDMVNMAKARSADLFCSVQALVSKYDFLSMRRIVGDKRAKCIATSDAKSFLFKTM